MSWRGALEFEFGDVHIALWRSDRGIWGYRSDFYDGTWRCFGLGKLLHVSWGPR